MAMNVSKLIGNCIVCDDIREESNGKKILIGVYGADIVVPVFPAVLSLQIYMEVPSKIVNDEFDDLHFKLSSGKEAFRMRVPMSDLKASFAANSGALGMIITPKFGVKFDDEGDLIFAVSANQRSWHQLISKRIVRGHVPGMIKPSQS